MISHSNHADIIWHNGGTGGFRNFLGFNSKTQKGIVVLSNSTEGWPDELSAPDWNRRSQLRPLPLIKLSQRISII